MIKYYEDARQQKHIDFKGAKRLQLTIKRINFFLISFSPSGCYIITEHMPNYAGENRQSIQFQ